MTTTRSVLGTDEKIKNEDIREQENVTTAYKDFLAIIKIGIVNSNLITAFTGVWLALFFTGKSFLQEIDIVLYTLIGSALVIAGSCAVNNYYDRDIDHVMERTKVRPTVAGRINPKHVLGLGIILILIGTGFLLLTTVTAAVIGLIGVFSYIYLYTIWSKRRYTINTVIGSISGAVPPLIGWAAIDPELHAIAWLLFLIMFIWQPPHFLALAMRRVEEYRAAGIPMLPVVHGFAMTKRQIMIWVLCLLPLPYYMFSLGALFVTIATLLNIGWLVLGFRGYKKKDDIKWAKQMFVYSLNYLTIMFVTMIIVTLV
ncbi:heme o synthase [Fredinandcohnia sp. QZ13]|uniref:heme o synthase n=1 Tax=Fredinandcohnia sp. QZ13 TaxID=3073144 RepID=UPI00285317CD|nr:heme o synthase [Fredinandcohnia sp. QZ13]MDR4886636.1 heme o synthase [Fredinandcohnia sp. QZ13]